MLGCRPKALRTYKSACAAKRRSLFGKLEPAPGPLGQAVFGGSENRREPGLRAGTLFRPAQVAQIAGAFQSPGQERGLYGRFDREAMTQLGIYPAVWETDDHDWLIEAFRTLRDFYTVASEAERAVVTLIAGRCYPDRMTLPSCRVVLCVPDARSIIAGHRISESHERIWRRSTPSQTTYSTPRVS